MAQPAILQDPTDFSLVLGGPLYQALRRAHLSGDVLQLMRRRIVSITAIAWIPLAILAALGGYALDGGIAVPFLYDIEAHARFLVALPILVAAERVVHERIRPAVHQFLQRGIITAEDLPRFHAAIDATARLRNSAAVEVMLIVFVYTAGLWIWRSQIALGAATWYAIPDGSGTRLTPAGYWYALVSVPLFQFILLRWYFRLLLWFLFLYRVSRLDLRLMSIHPDRAAGLGFVGRSADAFMPIVFAQGALLSGLIASQIFYAGQNLMQFKVPVAGLILFLVAVIFTPLLVFTPHLLRAKRQGSREYGLLASRYATEFREKWVEGKGAQEEPLLGSADIQSLADLGNSYAVVQELRPVPFNWKDVTRLAIVALLPLLPLTLTVISLEDLVGHLVKMVF